MFIVKMTSTESNYNHDNAKAPTEDNAQVTTTEVVLEQWTIDMLESVARNEGFIDFTLENSSGSNIGDGLMGIMRRVLIRGIRNGAEEVQSVMLKMPPPNKARQKQFHSSVLFNREVLMYLHVLPMFVKFQESHGLKSDGGLGFFTFPKCYASVCDDELDRHAIIMEDLKAKNYNMFDKFKTIGMEHVRLIMEELGKFHAVSFALHDQRPEEFQQFYDLEDIVYEYMMKGNFEVYQQMTLSKILLEFDESETEVKEKVDRLRTTFIDLMGKCVELRPERRAKSVINHGDCWNNNIMYQYVNGNSTPQKICLIDFQIARFVSPVIDLVFFIFTSTTKELRDVHYTDMLDIYYAELSRNIRFLGSDPDRLYSRADLNHDLKSYGKYGSIVAPMMLQVITAPADELPDMDQLAEDSEANANHVPTMFLKGKAEEEYNKRVCDVFRDMSALGYLDIM